jgi:hypothetical protein
VADAKRNPTFRKLFLPPSSDSTAHKQKLSETFISSSGRMRLLARGDFSSIIYREGVTVEVNVNISKTCVSVTKVDEGDTASLRNVDF